MLRSKSFCTEPFLMASHQPQRPDRMEKMRSSPLRSRCCFITLAALLWWFMFVFHFWSIGSGNDEGAQKVSAFNASRVENSEDEEFAGRPVHAASASWLSAIKRSIEKGNSPFDPCGGRYIYMHKIPELFNLDMVRNCRNLSLWTDMCKYLVNDGLGPEIEDTDGVFAKTGWFATNQFAVEVIFHNRMKQYSCLTEDAEKAAAVYVPFYAGLDVSRYLWGANITRRDKAALELTNWLQSQKEWNLLGGRDHFMVAGRITWDFRRETDQESDWGNKLLNLPAMRSMSVLLIEKSPYHFNDYGIPYPTYFHASKDADIRHWQDHVRKISRSALFAFAGASRPGIVSSIRGLILEQCRSSERCNLLECAKVEKVPTKCHKPSTVMKLFKESVFCLQPQGDSFTRRSIFDSMLAGCIPVFFHRHSAYTQYKWHLPKDRELYSVFIPEEHVRDQNVSIEAVLAQISQEDITRMRTEVIELIPGLTYADPRHRLETMNDAFDISVRAIIRKIRALKARILERGGDDIMEDALPEKNGAPHEERVQGKENSALRRWEGDRRTGER